MKNNNHSNRRYYKRRIVKEEIILGKKHRARINSPKKNNHIPPEVIEAEHIAHDKEYSASGRKNGPGHNK